MLDETAQQSLIAAIDMAISRCVDAFNIAVGRAASPSWPSGPAPV